MSLFDTMTLSDPLDYLLKAKLVLPILLLTLFWSWETWHPVFGWGRHRWRHAAHNLVLALLNTVILSLTFGTVTILVADWTTRNQLGLLHSFEMNGLLRAALALVLLDGWMYGWHRANHMLPFLWRFHRMHHSDNRMDVTTATRFHLGEHIGGTTLRLGLIVLLGFHVWHIVLYDLLVIAITQFHHADISLGRWDRGLRVLIVTPDMHKIHHSRQPSETDSNFSTLFSVWDRLAHTFRMRDDPKTVEFGLNEFDDPHWQTFWGMLRTPFIQRRSFLRRRNIHLGKWVKRDALR